MKELIKAVCSNLDEGTPRIVRDAMNRMLKNFSEPPKPVMTQEDFEKSSKTEQIFLICNMPGCTNVVCTHGLLCVKHHKEMENARSSKLSIS